MNIFAKLLAPKNKVFYELFEKSADNVRQMGVLLTQVVAESDFDKRQTLISKMEDVEHANDELTHSLFTELGRNFITPFDREDIHYLATSLDDVLLTVNDMLRSAAPGQMTEDGEADFEELEEEVAAQKAAGSHGRTDAATSRS